MVEPSFVGVGIVRGRAWSAATEIIGGIGDEIVVGNDVHVDGHIAFVHAVDPVHDQDFSRQRARYGIAAHRRGIFDRAGQGQAIGPQLRAGSDRRRQTSRRLRGLTRNP